MLKITLLAAILSAGVLNTVQASAMDRARDNPDAETVRVTTRGIDFNDEAHVRAFYERLQRAARRACAVQVENSLDVIRESEACQRRALDWAVEDANQPRLTAWHQAANRDNDRLAANAGRRS